jgi:MFS transporter, UMF1 family
MSELSITSTAALRAPKSGRLGQVSWALFEWARNPYYILVVIYIFGPYFTTEVIGDPVRGQETWGYINGFAGMITASLAPFLGAIADKVGRRKPWIGAFVTMMVPAIMLLWFAVPGAQGAAIVTVAVALTIAGTGSAFSEVFHNSMLPSIVPYTRLGSLSGLGLSLGNGGALVILTTMLYCFALPANGLLHWSFLPDHVLFGLNAATFEHDRIAGPITAVWLVLFSLPLFLFTPDQAGTGVTARQAVRDGLADVWQTIRQLRHYKNVGCTSARGCCSTTARSRS